MIKNLLLLAASALLVATPLAFSQQLDVLIIGSSKSFSEQEWVFSDVAHEKAFNPSGIATQLQSILAQDPAISEPVNVEFEDIYKTKQYDTAIGSGSNYWDLTYHCHSLIQHFMWPEAKTERLANLRGQSGHAWDYIVLCADPYLIANMPGVYAEGVKMIQQEVALSTNPAQIILLAQWPEKSSTSSALDFNEITYRVGNSAGLSVVPAGKAWDSFPAQDADSTHPTPKGAYLAAASIYSRIFGRNASTSAYTYDDSISDYAFSVILANDGAAQYTGTYRTENVFQMKYHRGRQVDWNEYGSSTEEGFAGGLTAALDNAKVGSVRRDPPASGNPVDLSYSRGNDRFEDDKRYKVNPAEHLRVHGFPMGDRRNTGPITMRYGIDKRYFTENKSFTDGTDLGIAFNMIREGEVPLDVRATPVRLLWSKIHHFQPDILSHQDDWHLSKELDRAVGAYLFTALTGRCPVEEEPADSTTTEWKQWFCRKLGYETAWQMAHLTTRAPGFRVLPSAISAKTVSPSTPETMTVQFINPPKADVTVTVSVSNPAAATLGTETLVFTPSNHNTPQEVTLTATSSASDSFDVVFNTSSDDQVFHGLSDAWSYTNNRDDSTAVTQTDQRTIPEKDKSRNQVKQVPVVDDNQVPAVEPKDYTSDPTLWSPAETTTSLWLDATDSSTIILNGSNVAEWRDKSGNNHHATQDNRGHQPSADGTINGLNAIQFNHKGGKKHLKTDLEQLTTVSMYLLLDPTARGKNGYSAAIGASASGHGQDSGLFWPIEQWADSGERNEVFYSTDVWNKVFCNGVKGSADHNFEPAILSHQGTNLPTANLKYLIANRSADLKEIFAYKGTIGEIIICPEEHDQATRQKMEGYLAHKWGISAELPSDHPYKDNPPPATSR